jgi:hypothetical protein
VRPKTSGSKTNYLVPNDLARVLKCSERTVREYCKQGKIREARKTRGGHWRIRRPLSEKTKLFLQKIKGDWPFNGSTDAKGEFDPDMAQWLMEAKLYEKDVDECFPAPDLADLEPNKRAAAARIQKLIAQRQANGKPVSDLLLLGSVYQFWLKSQRFPTVAEITELMGISRNEFYRRGHTLDEIRNAYHELCESIEIVPTGAF